MRRAASAIGILLAAVVASGIYALRRSGQQQEHLAAAAAAAQQAKSERMRYESSLTGRCQPFYDPAKREKAVANPLAVSIYFSLDRDCLSCVQELVDQWNGTLQAGLPLTVTGYTTVDGTQDERILTEKLKPRFPVVRVDQIERKLQAMGVTETPAVFVTNAGTGRILYTYTPLPSQKRDRAFTERLRLLATPCAAQ